VRDPLGLCSLDGAEGGLNYELWGWERKYAFSFVQRLKDVPTKTNKFKIQ